MPYDLDEKIEEKITRKLSRKHKETLKDGFDGNKTVNQVLNKETMMTLYEMINDKIIRYMNGVISAGKESLVFWAVNNSDSDVALKIYLTSTSNFKKRLPYLEGDPRFSRIKKGTRNIIHLWAQKEFRNLSQAYDSGVRVVKPLYVKKNVLAMEFVGKDGSPFPRLVDCKVNDDDYKQSIKILTDLYSRANLVHGDYSEYNLFKTPSGLMAFDFGSAVDTNHPRAKEFLKRDISNITHFFKKRGISVEDPEKLLRVILQ